MAAARRRRRAAAADRRSSCRFAATRSRRASTPRIRARASCPRPAGSCIWPPPEESLHVRVDTGVEEGDEITPYYDPMIAKLIVWDDVARTRPGAHAQALADVPRRRRRQQRRVPVAAGRLPGLCRRRSRHRPDRARTSLPVPGSGTAPDDVWLVAALAELLFEAHVPARRRRRAIPIAVARRDGWRLNGAARERLPFRLARRSRASTSPMPATASTRRSPADQLASAAARPRRHCCAPSSATGA